MPDLDLCKNFGAKFARLIKFRCNICAEFKCPSCSSCYCDVGSRSEKRNQKLINSKDKDKEKEQKRVSEPPLLVTIEYARFLKNKPNLQLKGHIEYIGQRRIKTRDGQHLLISDFIFYDRRDSIPLRIFGPVPQNLFKYRFAINRVLIKRAKVTWYKGNFELQLQSQGEIILLKEKSNQSLLKYIQRSTKAKSYV